MSRTEIPVYVISREEYTPFDFVNGDPVNGMFITGNAGYTWLEIDNPGSIAIQVGAQPTQNSIDGIPVADKIVDVAPGSQFHFGPFPNLYNHNSGQVYFDIDPDGLVGSAGTSLLFHAFATQ